MIDPRVVRLVRMIVCLVLAVIVATPAVGQITTNTALPVTRGHGVIRVQTKLIRSSGDPSAMDRELRVIALPLVAVYGISPRLAVFGVVPLVDKSLTVDTPLGRQERGPRGLGDVRAFTRYTAFQRNQQGQTVRLAPFAGIELPTGTDDQEDDLGPLPPPLQLGSGSWDPFAGFVFTWQTLAWQLDVSPLYEVNTAANGFRFGDVARLDAAFKVRVLPRELRGGVPGFLYVNLETNLIREDESARGGAVVPSTGGTTWYIAPGTQYITKGYVIEGAVQIPLVQDLSGDAIRSDYIATLSLRINI